MISISIAERRHRDTSSKRVLLRKREKKLEDAIYTTMLVTWDKNKDNKEESIQGNKRKCRNG
jgi:hypothetical protein